MAIWCSLTPGCEYQYYCGDITRTFPANGKFTDAQRAVYQSVLDVQCEIIESIRPGVSIGDPVQKAVEMLTEAMLELGVLVGEKEKVIEEQEYRKFYMHSVGHMLGVEVHGRGKDTGGGKNTKLSNRGW